MTLYAQVLVADPIYPEKIEKALTSLREHGMPEGAVMSASNYRAGLLLRASW